MKKDTLNKTEKLNILIADDKLENLIVLEALIQSPELNIVKARSGNEALRLMLKYEFALVLLDVQMPDMDGFETAKRIRNGKKTKHIPIIFVTATNKDQKFVFEGYKSGAVDYLFKPLDSNILKSKVAIFIDLYKQKKALESTNEKLRQTVEELEESKEFIEDQNRRLNDISIHDGLTGLYNHRHMDSIITQEFDRAKRYQTDLSCLLIDLDYFKDVNDTFGHAFGDFVLQEFSSRLRNYTRNSDISFRYGGEEFMVLLPLTDVRGAQKAAEKIRKLSESKSYENGLDSIVVTVSIGIASIKYHRLTEAKELLAYADKALYRAKAEGRNRVVIYPKESSEESSGSPLDESTYNSSHFHYLREHLSAILERTKRASIASLELLVRDMSGRRFYKHDQKVKQYIDLAGSKLHLPPTIIETFKRAAAIHNCFKVLLEGTSMSGKKVLDENKSQVEDHPYILAEMTELFDFFANERSVLLYHHENYDGTGYPEGLEGDQIP
ncbi:MAG: diguanylate cyclase, partial [Thermodesulfobacteriota bacterium]|nr:diguanylate cyclase [Thermodesulfobacteriota bacterium]